MVLGWIGNGRHYHADLVNLLKLPLENATAKHEVTFKLVGACGQQDLYNAFGAIPNLMIEFIDSLDWSDQGEILQAISGFDVGLYPLTDNDFNRYKCGFKALEYMAMGIPVVSSPVGANTEIIDDGVNGFLVDDSASWTNAILALINNRDLRISMGKAGRKKVEQEYDVKNHARLLARLLGAEAREKE